MGTFGGGGFENDEALDFAATIKSPDDLAAVFNAMPEDPMRSIESDEAQRIIAAAECVASMMGRPADDIPDNLEERLATFGDPSSDLAEIARNSVSRVMRNSELLDLWAEDDARPFNRAITLLIDRLNPGIKPKKRRRKKRNAPRQICAFCDARIELEELYTFDVSHVAEMNEFSSGIKRGAWCHLTCLNERLHPKHIVQNWKFDPEEIESQARQLLDLD